MQQNTVLTTDNNNHIIYRKVPTSGLTMTTFYSATIHTFMTCKAEQYTTHSSLQNA